MKKYLPTVTIGIAAYNSEKNIERLLRSLIVQKEKSFKLHAIVVYSDASNDETVRMARKIKDKRIVVVSAKKNNGFAYAVKFLLRSTQSDYVVLLNDDILIKDTFLLTKLVSPFLTNKRLGLTSGTPYPINRNTFVEKACYSSYMAFSNMRKKIKNGNNIFTCDGKVMVYSRKFITKVNLPTDTSIMGCVDIYMYLLCISSGFLYQFVPNAIVLSRNPSTVSDYVSLISRINSIDAIRESFGTLVDDELKRPFIPYYYYTFVEFAKNPLGSIFVVLTSLYILFKNKQGKKTFQASWKTVSSTKFSLLGFLPITF